MYKLSILGGTFAQFHIGHQKLLDTAFEQSEHVIVGISKPVLYQNKFLASVIEDYLTRENYIKTYLQSKGWLEKTTFIPIDDIWGNSLEEPSIETIFVTETTYSAAEQINEKRNNIGLPSLEIVTVPLVQAADGSPITSERIRKGEIDRDGTVYLDLFKKTLRLPDTMRDSLRHPLGEVVETADEALSLFDKNQMIISVGDEITRSLHEAKYEPSLGIIDYKTRRHNISSTDLDITKTIILEAKNEHGTISRQAVQLIHKTVKALNASPLTLSPSTIVIDGEEDLLALPVILLAPLGSVVLYGQFDIGVVINKVTEEKKKEITTIIKKFF